MKTFVIHYLDDSGFLFRWSTVAKDKDEALEKFKVRKGNRAIVKISIVGG